MQDKQDLASATPLRREGVRHALGYILLNDVGYAYRDGAESVLLDRIRAASDISSLSDELSSSAQNWPEQAHLDTARANVIRAFDLPAQARVLEIGAGCGAVTRYLGEVCAVVDALEPVAERAAIARERTRDLAGVEVFVGDLSDIPDSPTYDVIVVVGVLEYVGSGSANLTYYQDFLTAIRRRLIDGGTLILAIENRLGIKYYAGAPEDHSVRVFDSVEGYPHAQTPARTFSRQQLVSLMRDAELDPTVYLAFPDYKLTRAVMDPQMPPHLNSLLYRIPTFPSPDWSRPRPRLADERALWRTSVEAGLAAEHGNSFVVVARKSGAEALTLWPANRAVCYFSVGRRASVAEQTTVDVDADGEAAWFNRRQLLPPDGELTSARFVPGEDFVDAFLASPDSERAALMQEWGAIVDNYAGRGELSMDIVPHNLIRGLDGALHVIDIVFESIPVTAQQVLARGVYWLANRLANETAADRWPGAQSIRDLASWLGSLVGLAADGSWLETFYVEEVEIQARFGYPPAGQGEDAWRASLAARLRSWGERSLTEMTLGTRDFEVQADVEQSNAVMSAESELMRGQLAELDKRLDDARAEVEQLTIEQAELSAERSALAADRAALQTNLSDLTTAQRSVLAERDAARASLAGAADELAQLQASRWLRAARGYRRGLERLLPNGSLRRRVYGKVLGRR
ncbi:methyltransferase family protein [Jatrophihabitans sp. GAS493]|uniref:class I SAM-dependent methyltransferase n=1 Tax=Jatrophihabitans sp. GAS493 TaxID=1907575 RepID=UPI000BBFBD05|nr:class I SAM-dependent methyltransferase [Jatrophihabitans sp. GAS493]SOD71855.1 methyltransferase family protein [Jatrophihabitans sp. GAS493]